jgi:antitoxin ParD1/3/4
MATMNISLPDEMKSWVESQAVGGSYANASDYVRDLIREDRDRQRSIEDFRRLVDEGLLSEPSTMSMADIWLSAVDRATGAPDR